jgi:hypothetical protein
MPLCSVKAKQGGAIKKAGLLPGFPAMLHALKRVLTGEAQRSLAVSRPQAGLPGA